MNKVEVEKPVCAQLQNLKSRDQSVDFFFVDRKTNEIIIFLIFISIKIILISSYSITKFIAFSFQFLIFFSLLKQRVEEIYRKKSATIFCCRLIGSDTPPIPPQFPCLFLAFIFAVYQVQPAWHLPLHGLELQKWQQKITDIPLTLQDVRCVTTTGPFPTVTWSADSWDTRQVQSPNL